jgi:hypothetical protein
MTVETDHAGLAALAICEALLLALNDQGLLPEHEILGVLRDASETHKKAIGTDAERETHRAVAELIDRIIAGGNSARRR